MEEQLKRINKYLSEVGYCSRREADKLIEAGRVTINGVIPEMGSKISQNDVVEVDGKPVIDSKEAFVYLAFNKPVGIVCTTNCRKLFVIINDIDIALCIKHTWRSSTAIQFSKSRFVAVFF